MKKLAFPPYRVRALHLAAAWAFAVSQPIFSLLEGNPEFLVVRGATRGEVVLFALLLTFVPPLVALGCAWVVSRLSRIAGDVLYAVSLTAFLVPLCMVVPKELGIDSSLVIFLAPLVALWAVWAYARWRPVQLLVSFSFPLAVVGLVLFVVRAPLVTEDVAGAQVRVERRAPVVVVVFDELPVTSLMSSSDAIDARRFPHFARLARTAIWYRRATTVHDHTTAAVPAIATGRLPREGELPTLAFHRENLFTLLGESYRLRAEEAVTYLCPKRYCPRRPRDPLDRRLQGLFSDVRVGFLHRVLPTALAEGLPQIEDRWGGFEKERILVAEQSTDAIEAFHGAWGSQHKEYAALVRGIRGNEPPTLRFAHLILPHTPWHFLPSGRDYGLAQIPVGLVSGAYWSDRPWLVRQAYQRHLLQVGYTDGLLGRLLRRLKQTGLYDEALIVVTADHGMSFAAGEEPRAVRDSNIADIAPVPLFVKYPNQRAGRVDSRAVRTIDVLPTIADVLGVRLPWRVDGHSLLKTWPEPTEVAVARDDGGPIVTASFGEIERGKARALRRKAVFGPDWSSLLASGLDPNLLGRRVQTTSTVSSSGVRVRLDNAAQLAAVDTSSSFLPVRLTGSVEGSSVVGRRVAVALNGRIAAPTKVFRIDGKQRFGALLPERFFRDGYNRVELVAIEGTARAPRFTRLAAAGTGS